MKYKGFTLIELLVAVSILAITLTLALPGYSLLVQNDHAAAGANSLLRGISLARSEAVTSGSIVELKQLGASWQSGWEIEDSNSVTLSQHINSNDSISYVNPASSVEFLANGQVNIAPGTTITWTLSPSSCQDDGIRKVVLNVLGHAKVERSACP